MSKLCRDGKNGETTEDTENKTTEDTEKIIEDTEFFFSDFSGFKKATDVKPRMDTDIKPRMDTDVKPQKALKTLKNPPISPFDKGGIRRGIYKWGEIGSPLCKRGVRGDFMFPSL